MAVDDWPLMRWRMREYLHGRWGTEIVRRTRQLADDIVAAVAELGPSTAGQIEAHLAAEPRGRRVRGGTAATPSGWPRRLFPPGVLTTATRVGFARHYDLTERVLPPEVVAREVDDDEAVRELALRAATRARGRHRGRHPRLLPAVGETGQARDRQAGGRRRAGARRGRRLDGARRICERARPCRAVTAGRRCCARSTR